MAKEPTTTEKTDGKKKYKYVIETTEPLEDGKTYQMTFQDKRAK